MSPSGLTEDETRIGGALLGPYRTVKSLGSGGMANVLEAVDTRSGDVVALKVLHATISQHREAVARFTREARALQNLRHPNIVEILDHGVTEEGEAWIAMELLRGKPLNGVVRPKDPRETVRAVRLVADVAKALATVHARGLVHRDIKPENIFVVSPGTPDEHAKLIDFGIARVTDAELGEYSVQYTQAGKLLGSAAFMAPEQATGDAGPRADVFALGVTLYEMLTGDLPFEGRTPQAQLEARTRGAIVPFRKRVPDATFPNVLEDLVRRMLAPAPEDRPDGGLALLRELNTILQQLDGQPRGPNPSLAAIAPPSASNVAAEVAPVATTRPDRQLPLLLIVLLVALVIALGLLIVLRLETR